MFGTISTLAKSGGGMSNEKRSKSGGRTQHNKTTEQRVNATQQAGSK